MCNEQEFSQILLNNGIKLSVTEVLNEYEELSRNASYLFDSSQELFDKYIKLKNNIEHMDSIVAIPTSKAYTLGELWLKIIERADKQEVHLLRNSGALLYLEIAFTTGYLDELKSEKYLSKLYERELYSEEADLLLSGIRSVSCGPLTAEQLPLVWEAIRNLGILDEDAKKMFTTVHGHKTTGYDSEEHEICLYGDVLPIKDSTKLRDKVSTEVVIAHELIHYFNKDSNYLIGWNLRRCEFLTSWRA